HPQAAGPGGDGAVELVGAFGPSGGAGPGDDGVGAGHPVGDHGGGGGQQAGGPAGAVGEAFGGRGGDDEPRREGAEPVDEGGGVGEAEGGELVHQQQRFALGGFAGGGVVGEVLDQEPGQAGGVVAEGHAVEEEIGGPGVLVGPVTVEAAGGGGPEGPVAGQGAPPHGRVQP